MMVVGAGSSWHVTGLTLPSDADMAATPGLEQVACASAASCTAAGYYGDTNYRYHSILVTGSGSSWTLRQAPLPANAGSEDQSELNSIACLPDGNCVAVGWYIDDSGDEQGLIETGSGASWQASEAVLPSNAAPEPPDAIIAFLSAVSCPASNECVTVGQYDPSNGFSQGLVLTQTASGWTAAEAPQPTPNSGTGASLATVACWAAAHCLAAGFYQETGYSNFGSLVSISASSLTAVEAPLPANATDNNPNLTETGETCPSSATCLTYGQYTDASNYLEGTVLSGPGAAATAAEIPPTGSASPLTDAYPSSAACGSSLSCVIVGSAQLADGSTPAFIDAGLGSSWQVAQAPLPANAAQDTGSSLNSVACPTAGECVAVGSYLNDTSGAVEGLIDIGPTGTP